MEYKFSRDKFITSFNAKDITDKSSDACRLTHKPDNQFKLFSYKASGKTQAPIVTDLEDIVSGFFRRALKKKTEPIDIETLCDLMLEDVEIEEDDIPYFREVIQSVFFQNDSFIADSIGLYPYQTVTNNKSSENLAFFLFSVMGMNEDDCKMIESLKKDSMLNVLEEMVTRAIELNKVSEADKTVPYFIVKRDIQCRFKEDFYYMLKAGMTSLEDLANLLSVYYFYYVSQTCIILDQFCGGKRDGEEKLYYALDWEKVSKNRKCCEEGWDKLQGSINHMFSHAITLEILNQSDDSQMYDYISFGEAAKENCVVDEKMAQEVMKAEETYCSYIGDYKDFNKIHLAEVGSKTESAIMHLYKCVETQFVYTDRHRANQFYNEKFSEFCKERWVKNRKKSGLVLNLTERDVIFLTKICLRNEEKIRLNDLFKEYEKRGINLDNTSKELLQEFFTKLNLIDKKSDSGDAQYVKRIL